MSSFIIIIFVVAITLIVVITWFPLNNIRDLSAVKENAIISIENGLVSHKEIVPGNNKNKPIIRAENGSQYTSNAFRKSMSVLGLKLEHIACNTPGQDGHIESFHKTLKKEYIWPYDFRTYRQVEVAISDYNRDRIRSSLGYLTPYERVTPPNLLCLANRGIFNIYI